MISTLKPSQMFLEFYLVCFLLCSYFAQYDIKEMLKNDH